MLNGVPGTLLPEEMLLCSFILLCIKEFNLYFAYSTIGEKYIFSLKFQNLDSSRENGWLAEMGPSLQQKELPDSSGSFTKESTIISLSVCITGGLLLRSPDKNYERLETTCDVSNIDTIIRYPLWVAFSLFQSTMVIRLSIVNFQFSVYKWWKLSTTVHTIYIAHLTVKVNGKIGWRST